MEVVTLVKLQGGPLPQGREESAVLVTIWLAGILVCCGIFLNLVRVKATPIWPEFQRIFYGCLLLLIWYNLVVVDRWMHRDQRPVPFGYILLAPISEAFRVSSTILFLSGTFRVVWREVNQGEKKIWRVAGKVISFFSVLPALFYIILLTALAVCWLQFTSLNTIADIATRKTQFHIAMAAIFFGYAMVSATAATVTWCIKTRSQRGYVVPSRIFVIMGALILAARCALEFVLTLLVWTDEKYTRKGFTLIFDAAYGALTIAFLICHIIMSAVVGSRTETGGKDIAVLQSNIRNWIINRLEGFIENGKNRSPPLMDILREMESHIAQGQIPPDLVANSALSPEQNRVEAKKYLGRISREDGRREAKFGTEEEEDSLGSRATSALSGLWSRMSDNRGSRLSKPSNASLQSKPSRNFSPLGPNPIERPSVPVYGMGAGSNGAGMGHHPASRVHLPASVRENRGQFEPAESFQMRSVRTGRRSGL